MIEEEADEVELLIRRTCCMDLNIRYLLEDSPSCHRPSFKVSVNSFPDNGFSLEEALLETDLFTTKAACLGLGRLPLSLPSMPTTFDMVGRSFGSSCTHNSPTLKHFKNYFSLQVLLNVGSIKSRALFSFHNFQA
ncbi:hypothetical protein TIFTF001_041912 [Ficus carica]|uniref:Uncharacterized protein n=1 Tax=Ficus carica TaxID=3494 RepID=A0AA88A3S4_FICCA|nr:hypothetical protein TIFTF001_041912 [Ficus carica]